MWTTLERRSWPTFRRRLTRRTPARPALEVFFAPARELAVADPVPGPCKRLAEPHHQRDVVVRRTARVRFKRVQRVQRVPGEIVARLDWRQTLMVVVGRALAPLTCARAEGAHGGGASDDPRSSMSSSSSSRRP